MDALGSSASPLPTDPRAALAELERAELRRLEAARLPSPRRA